MNNVIMKKDFGVFDTVELSTFSPLKTTVTADDGIVVLSSKADNIIPIEISLDHETAVSLANAILQAADLAERQQWEGDRN